MNFFNKAYFILIFFSFFSITAQDILMQDGTFNQCSGTFYDSGGPDGDFSDNETFILTICPDGPDLESTLEFTFFEMNVNHQMAIYDADNASDPTAIIGTFTGLLADNPALDIIRATNPTGCLTVEFIAETFPIPPLTGWEAIIGCVPPCQDIEAIIDDITPSDFNSDIYTVNLSQTLDFEASAIFGDDFDQGATYEWDFGDGNTAVGQNVQHTYINLGTYFVNLTITDANGCSSSNTINQQVDVIFDATNPGPGCPNVSGEDVVFECDIPETTTLTSSFLNTGETTSYEVEPIPYAPPFPFTGLSNPISVNTDDVWSPNIDLPFDFCFFGNIETNIRVGSNGIISFQNPSGTNNFVLTNGDSLPGSNNALQDANIMLNHDIDPSVISSNPEVAWEIIGDAPCRTFVVSFSNLAHFSFGSCDSITSTFMMVLYETTNAIEFYIQDKGICNSWQDGLAVLGIQNNNASLGFSPPGRNIGTWTASQEAWRFTPNGPSNVTFQWFDPDGNFFSNDPTITVPVNGDETYSVEATYTKCDGEQVIVQDDATININPAFEVNITASDDEVCEGESTNLTANIDFSPDSDITIDDVEFQWFLDGDLLTETTQTITVTTAGLYTVLATGGPCSLTADFAFDFTELIEITIPPQNLQQCGDFSLSQTFNLTANDAVSLGISNPGDVNVSYHNTQADAEANLNPIGIPANYNPSNISETIFIRVENNMTTDCFTVGSFTIQIFDVEIFQPEDLESCDDGTGTETASFDLTQQNTAIFGPNQNSTTHSISYHTTQPDAEGGANPIPDPDNYTNTSNPQTIWARVQNIGDPSCFEVISFEILVTDSAPVNTDVGPLFVCDDDNDGFFNNFDLDSIASQINFDNPDVVVSFHLTPDDAENGVGAVSSPYANVVESQQVLYFRALDTNNGCEQFGDLLLQVFDSPLLTPIEEPLIGCDNDNDGFLFFDLTQIEAEVLGDLDPTDLDITYHLSLSDAQDGINAIIEPDNYQNATNPQTIWIRVTDPNSPVSCFDIEAFEIIVESTPDIVDPEPLEVCDDEESGDLSDEIATFDLNDKIPEITQGNNELLVEFFESQADLDSDNPINPIDSYVNITNPQTLEVKVTGETNGCVSFTTLTLVVNPVPSMAPELEPLEVCDPDNDGFAEFDLEAAIIDILNNEPDVTITFHLTLADAQIGANPIDTSSPFGTSNPGLQTIYVRAENTGPNGDDGTGCFDTRPLDLIVIPSPEIENLEDLTRCDDDSPNGFASFDLTVNTVNALGGQDPDDHLVTYHETQADAEQGINPIAIPSNYTNITNPQIIYVRIENLTSGCIDLFSSEDDVNNTFTLTVEALPVVNTPSVLEVCDDDDNQVPFPQTTFDLTVKEPEILGLPGVPANLQFSYFESQEDFDNANAIADPTAYINISQPQSIIVSVVDTATQNSCSDSTVLTISVLPLPSPSETDPDVLRLQGCDDDNDGVANQPFDLTQSGVLIAGSETVEISYYLTESGADTQDPDDLIGNPGAYVNQPSFNLIDEDGNPTNTQIIYVRVDNNVVGNFCYVIVPIELLVNPAPVLNPIGDPFAYTLCEDDDIDPGVAMLFSLSDITNNLWDLTNGSSDVIIPLLDPDFSPTQNIDDFVVTYHFTEQDAEDGINAISPGTSVSDGDILFIRVINPETSCFNTGAIGQVQMVIQPRPAIAENDPENIVICAEDINNPEVGTVDLTQQDVIINPGSPENTVVVYYAGMMNYNNGISIEDPTNFTTTQSPQTIIAEVINTQTLCESSRFVSFEVIINALPDLDISGFDGDIVCFDSDGNLIDNEVSPPTIDTGLSDDLYDFVWTLNGEPLPDTSASITAVVAGTYSVTATNTQTGCEATSSATIIESNPPEFQVTILTPSFSGTHVVEVNNITGNGDFEFQLDDGPWISLAPGQTTLVFSNIAPGLHVIRGRDSGGCGIIEVRFNLIDYPPFFTPNLDTFNDTWNITSLSDQPNAKIYIFDRYGKLLKQISPAGEGWDGTYNGKNMPAQDYWFRVEFVEPATNTPSTFKAHFTLKR